MSKLPIDGSIEAKYADGYILSETESNDVSPYDPQHNILRAVIEKHPEAEHGRLVLFSVFYKNMRYDIDWKTLPDNARPVRAKTYKRDSIGGEWIEDARMVKLIIGYQYQDESGKNIKEIREL